MNTFDKIPLYTKRVVDKLFKDNNIKFEKKFNDNHTNIYDTLDKIEPSDRRKKTYLRKKLLIISVFPLKEEEVINEIKKFDAIFQDFDFTVDFKLVSGDRQIQSLDLHKELNDNNYAQIIFINDNNASKEKKSKLKSLEVVVKELKENLSLYNLIYKESGKFKYKLITDILEENIYYKFKKNLDEYSYQWRYYAFYDYVYKVVHQKFQTTYRTEKRVAPVFDYFGIEVKEHKDQKVVEKDSKVLLIYATSALTRQDIQEVIGQTRYKDRVEEVRHEEIGRFDILKYQNNPNYLAILFGPIPHKMKNLKGHESIIDLVEKNPEVYPKSIRLTVNNELKVTKSALVEALKELQVYDDEKND